MWCEQELVLMRRQLEFLQSGKIGTHERDDRGSQIDTSSQTAKQLEMKITALESLLIPDKAFTQVEIARE